MDYRSRYRCAGKKRGKCMGVAAIGEGIQPVNLPFGNLQTPTAGHLFTEIFYDDGTPPTVIQGGPDANNNLAPGTYPLDPQRFYFLSQSDLNGQTLDEVAGQLISGQQNAAQNLATNPIAYNPVGINSNSYDYSDLLYAGLDASTANNIIFQVMGQNGLSADGAQFNIEGSFYPPASSSGGGSDPNSTTSVNLFLGLAGINSQYYANSVDGGTASDLPYIGGTSSNNGGWSGPPPLWLGGG